MNYIFIVFPAQERNLGKNYRINNATSAEMIRERITQLARIMESTVTQVAPWNFYQNTLGGPYKPLDDLTDQDVLTCMALIVGNSDGRYDPPTPEDQPDAA